VNVIQAHQMAKNVVAKPPDPVRDALGGGMVQLRRGGGNRHHEGQVEQQFERRRHPVRFMDVAPAHGTPEPTRSRSVLLVGQG
jgi:hypothetical protein